MVQLEAGTLRNLLLEHEDALPLLGRQHGDLVVGELEHLHDEGGLLLVDARHAARRLLLAR